MNGEELQQSAPYDPGVIDSVVPSLFGDSYEEAIDKLKYLYENSEWTDKELAAQRLASAASRLQGIHQKQPEINLNDLDVGPLVQKILDPTQGENPRIEAVEEFRQKAKEALFNTDSADKILKGGEAYEQYIDAYATQLRRDIVGNDVSRLSDMVARGAQAALSPVLTGADLIFDTDISKSVEQKLLSYENPDYDGSFLSSLATFGGSIAGFTAASLNPYTAASYLGAMLIDQGKSVYDTALQQTGSEEAAREALVKASPWIGIGAIAPKVIGGSLAKVFKEGGGYLNALSGATVGAVGTTAQVVGTGAALADVTGDKQFLPQPQMVVQEAAAGALLGGAAGLVSDVATKGAIKLAEDRLAAARNKVKETITGKKTTEAEAVEETTGAEPRVIAAEQFVKGFEESIEGDRTQTQVEESRAEPAEWWQDNPVVRNDTPGNREWLVKNKRTATAGYDNILVDPKTLLNIPDENPTPGRISQTTVDKLASSMQKEGFKARSAPLVIVDSEGNVKVWEGNHRIRAAAQAGLKEIPVEIRYEGGSETIPDVWKPKITEPRERATDLNADLRETIGGPGERAAPGKIAGKGKGKPPPTQPFKPTKILRVAPKNAVPSPLIIDMVKQLGGKIQLKQLMSSWGFYETPTFAEQLAGKQPRIVIERGLFKDVDHAIKTLAHEFGHMLDAYGRTREAQELLMLPPNRAEPIPIKLLRFQREFISQFDNPTFKARVIQLSKDWRPGWNEQSEPKYQSYRMRTTELYADLTSAMLNNRAWVKKNYPEVYHAWRIGLERFPEIRNFLNKADTLRKNPRAMLEWEAKKQEAGRIKQAKLHQKFTEERLAEEAKEAKELPKKAVSDFIIRFVNRFAPAKNVLTALAKKGYNVEEISKLYNALYSWPSAYKDLRVLVDMPLFNSYENYLKLGIPNLPGTTDPYSSWKMYERYNRILKDTNLLIESIKTDPKRWITAAQDLRDVIGLKGEWPTSGLDERNLSGMELVRGLAKLHTEVATPKQRASWRKQLINEGKLDAAALLEEGAFDVRSLIGNPEGLTYPQTVASQKALRDFVGEENWKKLEEHSRQYHSIIGPLLYNAMKESGLADAKLLQHMKLNENNYITFNVLSWYEKNKRLSGAIRKQYGTLNSIGDELASTEMKSKAILLRAEFQKAINSAVEIARKGDYSVTAVEPEYIYRAKGKRNIRLNKDVFEQREKLQKQDPKNSYMIEYKNGRPTLYKIDSPDFAKMFSPGSLQKVPAMSLALKTIEGFNRLFMARELKTIFSLPFTMRSRFYDRAVEAIYARSVGPTALGVHLDKAVRDIRHRAKQLAREYHKGNISPEVQEMIDAHGLSYFAAEDFGGWNTTQSPFEAAIYKAMGIEIPGEESFNWPARVNKKMVSIAEKLPFFKQIKETAMIDETATKIAGYLIGKEVKGYGPQEAAMKAREWFGTPDPLGGGTEATNINKLFLFGRAHVNGLRAIVNQFKEDPRGFGMQYAYRKGIPRLMTSAAIMGPLIGALFGDDEEKVYRAFLNKMSSYNKIAKFNIPLGFVDEQGSFRGFNVSPDEITSDWKAAAISLPVSREFISLDQLTTPFIKAFEDLLETGTISGKHIARSVAQSFGAVFGGSMAPAVHTTVQAGQLISGYNPYDFYRNRGILPNDVQEAGTYLQKFYEYMLWSLNNNMPSLFTYQPKAVSTDASGPFQYLAGIPEVGPAFRSFVSIGNYGDFERSKELEQRKLETDAELRLHLGPESKKLFNEYRKAQALITRLGKTWHKDVSPEQRNKIHRLNNWHARYVDIFGEMRNAYEKDDDEALEMLRDRLETSSASRVGQILGE